MLHCAQSLVAKLSKGVVLVGVKYVKLMCLQHIFILSIFFHLFYSSYHKLFNFAIFPLPLHQ